MSNLSIFKIGVGPSSSHTLGPMLAGNLFCELVGDRVESVSRVEIVLYGSLSLTGRGHLSDKAVLWGLSNLRAQYISTDSQSKVLDDCFEKQRMCICGKKQIHFEYERDLIFSKEFLPLHENALKITAFDECGKVVDSQVYYSTGGGFIATQAELEARHAAHASNEPKTESKLALEIDSAAHLLELCAKENKNLAQISLDYELQFHTREHISQYCKDIWSAMEDSYHHGCNPSSLELPGKMHLHRRAKGLSDRMKPTTDPFGIIDYVSLYAIAIAEENAAGGRVVTAPTNGACAVIPAVILYLKNHTIGFNENLIEDFLLSAMLIGSLIKRNASISGAEAGCQAEIGSASSMAAAAMATTLGASAPKACNAAEIAMEHHLGLTCDPVGGLVQVPCIERNAFGAIKAISAVRIAMSRTSQPIVDLDQIIATMYQTGKDMNRDYKETSLGGLAKTLSSVC